MRKDTKHLTYGLSAEVIAGRCGVNVKTAQRWKSRKGRMPATAAMVLSNDLGELDPAWRGWSLHNGQLGSPENIIATPGEVLSLPFLTGQIAIYQAELRALKERTEGLKEQPAPDADAGTVLGRLTNV